MASSDDSPHHRESASDAFAVPRGSCRLSLHTIASHSHPARLEFCRDDDDVE